MVNTPPKNEVDLLTSSGGVGVGVARPIQLGTIKGDGLYHRTTQFKKTTTHIPLKAGYVDGIRQITD